jgi:ABC-2 type transport system ATP-binding protein
LIKGLGGKHTVILSTHILPEVTMTCEKVLILHQGRLVAFDALTSLVQTEGSVESLEETFLRLTRAA